MYNDNKINRSLHDLKWVWGCRTGTWKLCCRFWGLLLYQVRNNVNVFYNKIKVKILSSYKILIMLLLVLSLQSSEMRRYSLKGKYFSVNILKSIRLAGIFMIKKTIYCISMKIFHFFIELLLHRKSRIFRILFNNW